MVAVVSGKRLAVGAGASTATSVPVLPSPLPEAAAGLSRPVSADCAGSSTVPSGGPGFRACEEPPQDRPRSKGYTSIQAFIRNRIQRLCAGCVNALDWAGENAYALDSAHGLLATKYFVYELSRYDLLTSKLDPDASQLFFDNDGVLWFLSLTDGSLNAQIIKR